MSSLSLCLTALLLLALVPSGAAQTASGTGAPSGPAPVVSPFFPGSDDGGDDGGGSGPYAPPDSGVPPQTDPNEDSPPSSAPATARGVGRRAQSGRPLAGGVGATSSGSNNAVQQRLGALSLRGSWLLWWETNKFDFIELRRVRDAPLTGQGRVRETDEQREQRLAEVDRVIAQAVIPVLRELTASPDPAVRAAAVVSLGKLRDTDSMDLARAMLTDGSRTARDAAMVALGIMESGRGRYALMSIGSGASFGEKLLDQSSLTAEQRGTALLAAALRGGDDVTMVIEEILESPGEASLQLLAATCEAAGLMDATEATPLLTRIARDRAVPEFVRSSAVSALGRLRDPEIVPTLMEVLARNDLEPRRAAVAALGLAAHSEMPGAIERLITVLDSDTDASSRFFAAVSLGRLGGERARQALLDAWNRDVPDMRPWIALGLGLTERSMQRGDISLLISARVASEANPESAAAYLIALGLCGGDEVIELLSQEARGRQAQRAAQAAMALGLTRRPDALPVLREVLATTNSPVIQRRAALALGILGNSAAVPDLIDLMAGTKNADVASFAALGISLMGDENAIGPLLHVIEKHGPRGVATTYAASAIGQLFDADRRPVLSRLAAGDNYLARSDAATNLLLLGF